MTDPQTQISCPVCNSAGGRSIFRMKNMPAFCNFLRVSAKEAKAVTRGEIELVFCGHCSHIYNRQFNPDLVRYQPGYENSLHYSPRYRSYSAQQVERLLDTYLLHGQEIVDIGCGQGEFLRLFFTMGNCRGTGFEPSADPLKGHDVAGVRIIPSTFSEKYFCISAKCFILRHVLEHLPDPVNFLKTIRLGMNNENGVLFLEIPDGSYMLEHCSIWDIIYEHYSYFTPLSLWYLLGRTGFRCTEPQSGFGGQYLFVDAFPQLEKNKECFLQEGVAANDISRLAEEFALCCRSRYEKVEIVLETELLFEKKVVLWGAGSKAVTLLNHFVDFEKIQYVVDVNPGKQGKYIPGSGQLVVSPQFLTTFQPDTVLIMNDIYRQEIQKCLDSLNVFARINSL